MKSSRSQFYTWIGIGITDLMSDKGLPWTLGLECNDETLWFDQHYDKEDVNITVLTETNIPDELMTIHCAQNCVHRLVLSIVLARLALQCSKKNSQDSTFEAMDFMIWPFIGYIK